MKTQEYEPAHVAQGLKTVCTNKLNGFFSPERIDKEMQGEIKTPFFLPNIKYTKRFSNLDEFEKNGLCNMIATRKLLEDIAEQIQEPVKTERKTLDLIEQKLKGALDSDLANSYTVGELQFQYPHLARGKYACVLDRPTDEIKSFNYLWFDMLETYTEQHKGLAEEVMHKAYDIYLMDNERGIAGRRRLGALVSMMPTSLALSSQWTIEHIGRGLGLSKEETYRFVGTTKGEIEKNEEEWMDKAKKIIDKEGLGAELEGEIILKVN